MDLPEEPSSQRDGNYGINHAQSYTTDTAFMDQPINSFTGDRGQQHELIEGLMSIPTERISAQTHQTLGQIAESFHDKYRGQGNSRPGEFDDSGEEIDDGDDDAHPNAAGSESTGRWTRQEHELFLEALKKYGKEWKKVASMVRTRTVVQTRTHAQKYFQKLAKANGGNFNAGEDIGSAEKMAKRSMSSSKRVKRPDEFSPPFSKQGYPYSDDVSMAMMSTPAQTANYFPLGTDDLTPFAARITPLPASMEMPRLRIPPPPPHFDFPQPSPAACGKRKQAELAAAEMLAGSAQSRRSEGEGISVLSQLKESGDGGVSRKLRMDLSLSIMDPDAITTLDVNPSDPGTPWDAQIMALSAQSRVERNGSNSDLKVRVATPSEQRQFLAQVRSLMSDLNLNGLRAIFEAAEASAESYLSTVSPGPHARTMSVSDLLAESGSGEEPNKTIPPLSSDAPVETREGNSLARDLIRRSINKLGAREQSVLHDAILLDAPQSIVFEICKLLIDYGASARAVDGGLNSGLHLAARRGFEKVGRLLLSKGCPVNGVNGESDAAVHIAARLGHTAFLEMLASLGANFHLRNGQASSPIDLAGTSAKDSAEREALRRHLLTLEPRLRTLILYHDDFLEHTARKPSDWEAPDRLQQIMRRLRDNGEFRAYEVEISSQFEKGDVELLGRVHSPDYLSFVSDLAKQVQLQKPAVTDKGVATQRGAPLPFTPHVQRFLLRQHSEEIKPAEHGSDTAFSAGTLNAARRAAGAVAYAVDRVMLGRNRNVFCVVRPPGHHAGYRGLLDGANSCGFCIFNNVAAGALHALEDHHCERVAIIDLDIHHGNGTEDIVRRYPNPSRLFFFSVHLYDSDDSTKYQFYPGTGRADDHVHNIINVPLVPLWKAIPASDGSRKPKSYGNSSTETDAEEASPEEVLAGREAFRRAVLQRLIPSLRAFNPSLILLSMGFDALNDDVGNCKHTVGPKATPQRGMDLGVNDIAWVTSEIMKIADICCNGRLISVLEGGYGQYAGNAASKGYGTRSNASSNSSDRTLQIDANAMESQMNRGMLAEAAAAHVHRLVDPYGPQQAYVTAARSSMVPPPPLKRS